MHSYPITCAPELRTFNSDGTRISQVGLKDWNDPQKVMTDETSDKVTRDKEYAANIISVF